MMTLTDGTKLGPFEILSHQGAGGMGDVYSLSTAPWCRTCGRERCCYIVHFRKLA